MLWLAIAPATRLLFRIRVVNRPKDPGGYVLAANHSSFLDPIFLGSSCYRRVHFMMTVIACRSALMGWFYRVMRAIPVEMRGGNRDALRAARAVLERGEVLGIFPEGGISRDGGLLRGNPGAVSLGLAGGVPIIPVALVGAHEAFPPGRAIPRLKKVSVVFGEPIDVGSIEGSKRERLERATELIMQSIADLRAATAR